MGIKKAVIILAGKFHENAPDHPPENFRGCTHPKCKKLKKFIKRLNGKDRTEVKRAKRT